MSNQASAYLQLSGVNISAPLDGMPGHRRVTSLAPSFTYFICRYQIIHLLAFQQVSCSEIHT